MGTCTSCVQSRVEDKSQSISQQFEEYKQAAARLEDKLRAAAAAQALHKPFYEQIVRDLPDLSKVVEWLNDVCIEEIVREYEKWLREAARGKRAAHFWRPEYFPHEAHKERWLSVQSTLKKAEHVTRHLVSEGRGLIAQLQPSTSLRIACAAAKYDTFDLQQQQDISWVLVAVAYRLLAYLPPSQEFVRDAMLDEFLVFGTLCSSSCNFATAVVAMLEMHGVTSPLELTVLIDKCV